MKRFTLLPLGLQQLEAREVPAITLVGDVLTITGTPGSDTVTVVRTGQNTATTADDNVVATHTYQTFLGPVNLSKTYNTGLVGEIKVTLEGGHDYFDNDTTKKATVWGGSGNDELRGGGGLDILYGEGGNDQLYGGGAADLLYGGANNDRLYGGSGNDYLNDSSGTNGLYGGAGTDTLMGGTGSDRFLDPDGDFVVDQGGSDALIDFNGTVGLVYANFGDGTATYMGGSWTESEVIRVDGGLAAVHEGMGNPEFLKYDGVSIDVRKVGDHLVGPGGGVLGWNSDSGVITITQLGLDQVDGDLAQTVIHEIGHNWDESDENSTIGQFRSISGWLPRIPNVPTPVGYAVSGDGNWWHKSNAKFTREYAKTNPKEDFADAFAAFWLHKAGIETTKLSFDFNDLPEKMNYMQDFVNGL